MENQQNSFSLSSKTELRSESDLGSGGWMGCLFSGKPLGTKMLKKCRNNRKNYTSHNNHDDLWDYAIFGAVIGVLIGLGLF